MLCESLVAQNLMSSEEDRRENTIMPRNPGHYSPKFQGRCATSAHISPCVLGWSWKGAKQRKVPCVTGKLSDVFDSQFLHLILLSTLSKLFPCCSKELNSKRYHWARLIYNPDSQQIVIKLTLGPDGSVLFDPNCLEHSLLMLNPGKLPLLTKGVNLALQGDAGDSSEDEQGHS